MAQSIRSNIVPAVVTKALSAKYPAAKKVTWEKENGNFEANWGGRSGEDMSVQFTPQGSFIEQVKAISVKQLPDGVFTHTRTHNKGSKVSEAGRVIDAQGATSYEVEIRGKDMIFDDKGKFVRSETE